MSKVQLGLYAEGDYECKCVNCKDSFIGDKRSSYCLPCAILGAEQLAQRTREAYKALNEWHSDEAKAIAEEHSIISTDFVLKKIIEVMDILSPSLGHAHAEGVNNKLKQSIQNTIE